MAKVKYNQHKEEEMSDFKYHQNSEALVKLGVRFNSVLDYISAMKHAGEVLEDPWPQVDTAVYGISDTQTQRKEWFARNLEAFTFLYHSGALQRIPKAGWTHPTLDELVGEVDA